MTRVALAPLLLLAACAAPLASSPVPPEPNAASTHRTFTCQASARPNSYEKLVPLEPIKVSGPDADRSVTSGAFRFRVLYWDNRYDGRTVITYVYSASTGKLIEESLFQLDRVSGPLNEFLGGHGFTGLHYVYAPDSDAELQYICSSGG